MSVIPGTPRRIAAQVSASAADPREVEADLLVVPVFKGGIDGPGVEFVLGALGLARPPVTPDFRGDIGQHLIVASPATSWGGVMFVGLGRMDATDPERLRRAAGVAAGAARWAGRVATTLAQVHPSDAAVQAIAEGFMLGAYADHRHKTPEPDDAAGPGAVVVLVPSSRLAAAGQAIDQAVVYAEATAQARDLVNLPPAAKRPPDLADAIAALAGDACEVRIRDERALADGGFGGILAVGAASSAPPRLVELRFRPPNPLGHVVLVGKGITFDTGGLSLKRDGGMDHMKSDMAGAAAIAAACACLRGLDVRLDVTALLPLAENMPGADAWRPDDVVRLSDGTTVEVRDTDAEGRMVLADALALGASMGPDAIVDLATLTGASIRAVGRYAAALFSTDEALRDSLLQAAALAGEPLWPLPLWDDLEPFLETAAADLNNTGDPPGGGAVMAALFLRHFVGTTPWAHLDMAGPAFMPAPLARDYLRPGGTGYGVRTLLGWLERRAS